MLSRKTSTIIIWSFTAIVVVVAAAIGGYSRDSSTISIGTIVTCATVALFAFIIELFTEN